MDVMGHREEGGESAIDPILTLYPILLHDLVEFGVQCTFLIQLSGVSFWSRKRDITFIYARTDLLLVRRKFLYSKFPV